MDRACEGTTFYVSQMLLYSSQLKQWGLPVSLPVSLNSLVSTQTLKAFLPAMMAKNRGHVITIASGAGLFGVAGLVDYCASKFGAVGIHKALTSELHSTKMDGIHTTCVCPYFINTGMFDGVKTR